METKNDYANIGERDSGTAYSQIYCKLSLLFCMSFGFNTILLLGDSVVTEVKMFVALMGNLPK